MHYHYLLLDVVVLIIIVGTLYLLKKLRFTKTSVKTMLILLALTALFDSILIAVGIFYYDTVKITQLYIGKAPIEDFFYPVLAAIVVPSTWAALKESNDE